MTNNLVLVEVAKGYLNVRESSVNNIGPAIQEMQKATWLRPGPWPWCFDEDVEALTNEGWVKLKDLRGDELVATAKPDGSFYFDSIVSLIRNPEIEQEIAIIKNRNIELTCTSNHRFGGYWNNKKFDIKPISEITTSLRIPVAHCKQGISDYTDSDIKFIAAFICDGFFHKGFCEFQISKERKIEALKEFNVRNIYTSKKIYGISKMPLTSINFDIPKWFDKVFSGYKILNQIFINNLSARQAKLFIETYNFYDGSTGKTGRKTLSTSRESSIDYLTQIATIAGIKYSVTTRISGIKNTLMWIMCYNDKVNTVGIKRSDIVFIKKTIPTYCIETKTGLFVIRDKNKNSIITGNCAAFMCHVLKKALENPKYAEYIESRYNIVGKLEDWRCKDASAFGWITWAKKIQLTAKHKDIILFDEKKSAKAGDIVVYDFSHIGIVSVDQIVGSGKIYPIEGNTSPKTTQRDGVNDGIYEMLRSDTLVKSYIRI